LFCATVFSTVLCAVSKNLLVAYFSKQKHWNNIGIIFFKYKRWNNISKHVETAKGCIGQISLFVRSKQIYKQIYINHMHF